jgi:hypothetical protein
MASGAAAGSRGDLTWISSNGCPVNGRHSAVTTLSYFTTTRTGSAAHLSPFVVKELKTFIKNESHRYDTIVLVCHSQGGILGKRYIIEELQNGRGKEMKIDKIVTLNTPHHGASPLAWPVVVPASCFKLWPISKLRLFSQLADLAPYSDNINFLKTHWGEPLIAKCPQPPAPNRRYIESVTIYSAGDPVVTAKSAKGFEVDHPDPILGGHSVDRAAEAEDVGQHLSRHLDPIAVEQELRAAYSTAEAQATHELNCLNAAKSVISQYGSTDPAYQAHRSPSFVADFRDDFPQRPMRNLSLMDCFSTYVKKVLTEK